MLSREQSGRKKYFLSEFGSILTQHKICCNCIGSMQSRIALPLELVLKMELLKLIKNTTIPWSPLLHFIFTKLFQFRSVEKVRHKFWEKL